MAIQKKFSPASRQPMGNRPANRRPVTASRTINTNVHPGAHQYGRINMNAP